MEKRKENARYLNQCFTMMVLLNVIIVLFLTFTIVLTQYRVAAAQEAQKFIGTLKVMPERPEQKIIMVVFSLCFLCGIIYYKRRNEEEGKEKVLLWNVFEIIFLIFVLKELDMTYNGVIFLIVADMLTYVEDRKNKLIFLFISFLCYMVCSYNLVTMFIPLNSFETWVAFYDGETESLFLGVKTICEILNMILFLVYIVILMMKDKRERERIQLLNAQLQKANEQLHELGIKRPTHVFVQAGVGSLAGAVVGYFAHKYKDNPPVMAVCEASAADCLYRSAVAKTGNLVNVTGDLQTIMAGLACGEGNTIGWDILKNHVDVFASCPDWMSAKATRIYANPLGDDPHVVSGESGSVPLGFCFTALHDEDAKDLKEALKLDENSVVLLISTEGDTDPVRYREIVWDGLYGTDESLSK